MTDNEPDISIHSVVSVCAPMLSCVQFFVTPWTIAHKAPLSLGLSRQEYWSGLPCPPPGNLPHPGIKPASPLSPAWQVGFLPLVLWEARDCIQLVVKGSPRLYSKL